MGIFDNYHYHGAQHHSHTTTVTENRAPTDESVRLLKEFENEALNSVVDHMRLQDNVFGDITILKGGMYPSVILAFKLNGKQYKFTFDEMEIEMMKMHPHTYAQQFFDKVSNVIAEELFGAWIKSKT